MAALEPITTLITGAAGFLGWHVRRLLARPVERRRVFGRPTMQGRVMESHNVACGYGDFRHKASLANALEGVRQVFHVAADYRLWAKNPDEIYENNVVGTRNLLAASREAGVERFVYTSSVATIAVPSGDGLPDEGTPTRLDQMIGHYKRSKFMAEQEVMEAAAKGFPAVLVNPTTPVGAGDWKPTPTGRIIVDFLNGRIPAYVDTGFNVVAVEDVAEGHWLAAQHSRIGERYILGGRHLTLEEVPGLEAAKDGCAAPRMRLPYAVALAAGYTENFICSMIGREPRIPLEGVRMAKHKMFVDGSRAIRELGFRPTGIEAAIGRAVDWHMENGYVVRSRLRSLDVA